MLYQTIEIKDPFVYRTDEHQLMVVKKMHVPNISGHPLVYEGDLYQLNSEDELVKEKETYEITFSTEENLITDIEG